MTIAKAIECVSKVAPAQTAEAVRRETLAMFDRYNIRHAVADGTEHLDAWRAADPERVIPAMSFEDHNITPEQYRDWYEKKTFQVFAEVGPQYAGLSPADPVYEPYFALAEELDIPIGLHMGEGPPGGRNNTRGSSPYRVQMGNPLLLEEVLVRHPHLRIYVAHYGSPLVDEMVAMLYSNAQL